MRTPFARRSGGFTLIELAMAMGLGMSVAALVLALANQQLAFIRIFRAQSFLVEEAPMVSTHVSKLVGKADRFRLHDNLADALTGANPRLGPSPVLVMNFRQPGGGMRASILAFEERGEGGDLNYYVVPESGPPGDPEWSITRRAADVTFSVESGILRMRLTGENGEQITYSGTMQQ
jgi:hypothetical protein